MRTITINTNENVRPERTLEYFLERRLQVNLKHVQTGDELGARWARELSEIQAEQWSRLLLYIEVCNLTDVTDYLEWRSKDDDFIDLHCMPYDPPHAAFVDGLETCIEEVKEWAITDSA